jgi:hypothetical protein
MSNAFPYSQLRELSLALLLEVRGRRIMGFWILTVNPISASDAAIPMTHTAEPAPPPKILLVN